MLQIDKTILSLDILDKRFACDLKKCKGACCIHGDSGAPLEENEVGLLEQLFFKIKPYLRKVGVTAIEKQGTSVIDSDGDKVTPLVNNKECAYVVFEAGIAKCAIEKAFLDNEITFRKPISCHLYPIRITKYFDFEALNYHKWEICKAAITQGEKDNIPLYIYLSESLTRKFGKEWYQQLRIAANEFNKGKNPQIF
jgi:hypothetical protein